MKKLVFVVLYLITSSYSIAEFYIHDCSASKEIEDDILFFDSIRRSSDHDENGGLAKQPFIAISLGSNCHVAVNLQTFKLRGRSFPFDWNVTPFGSLCSMIENNFEGVTGA